MHIEHMADWRHAHRFAETDPRIERRMEWVVFLTAATMAAEILTGYLSGSMALLADGWHMGTHMFALGIAVFAGRFARRHKDNPVFTFGTGKVASLAGFTSAVALGIVAFGMVTESIGRLLRPHEIHFAQAMTVALVGLAVNLVCAGLLHDSGLVGATHGRPADHNRRAAFVHVAADALTSLLAVAALVAVRHWGLKWMDPVVALVGAALITVWAAGLLRDTGRVLLDAAVDAGTATRIRECLEADADNRVADLHVWRVGGDALSLAVSVVTHTPRPAKHYLALLRDIPEIRHTTIEVIECGGEPCLPDADARRG